MKVSMHFNMRNCKIFSTDSPTTSTRAVQYRHLCKLHKHTNEPRQPGTKYYPSDPTCVLNMSLDALDDASSGGLQIPNSGTLKFYIVH